MASEREITDVVDVLSGIYGKEPGDLRGYYWTLGDIDADLLERAAQSWVKHNKWLPQPSELLDLAQPMQNRRFEYWRHVQLFEAIATGRRDDERAWQACKQYFTPGKDIPTAPPDTRTDAELEAEYRKWQASGGLRQY